MAIESVNISYYCLDERHAKIQSPKFKFTVTKPIYNEKRWAVKVPVSNIQINLAEFEYVENIVIYICKEMLGIGPIARHLFSLHSPSRKVWLAANQTVDIFDKNFTDLVLMIRFKPTDPVNLARLDKQAFDYYFCQMRDAFHKATVRDICDKLSELISLNVLITVIEENIVRDRALKSLWFHQFAPIGLEDMAKSFQSQKSKVDEMHQALDKAWKDAHNNQENLHPADFIKAKFISKIFDHDEYEHPIIEEFCQEVFSLQFINDGIIHAKKCRFRNQYLSLSINVSGDWVHLVYLNEINFIKPLGDSVEIEFKNGTNKIAKGDELEILSFCSLLEGYYLLTVDPEKNICKCVTPPTIEFLHKYDIHGPLDFSSVNSKLKQEGCGTYLITADGNEYCYNLYVRVPEGLKAIRIKEVIKGSTIEYIIPGHNQVYLSLTEIKENLKISSCEGDLQLTYSLKPKGFFLFPDFPIFQNVTIMSQSFQKVNDQTSEVFCSIQRNLEKILTRTKRLGTGSTFDFFQLTKNKENFVWKVFKRPSEAEKLDFLTKATDWKSLNSELVVQILSVSLKPPAIKTDYYQHGSLNKYLEAHRDSIKVIHLLECAHFLAKTLHYLQERAIVHGNIRCRSIWVINIPLHPLGLKLGDPFINVDKTEENLWVAPESALSDPLPLSVDVWAAATTMWEIFSYGMTRPARSVHHLNCPFSCPLELWQSINRCWVPNPHNRESPFYLLQHIQNLIMQEYKSSKVVPNVNGHISRESTWSLPRFHKLLFRSKSSQSNGKSLLSDVDSLDLSDSEDQTTWVIPSSRLQIHIHDGKEEVLGKGNYGEVIKARYLPWPDKFVAVKRINTKHKQRPSIVKDMLREFEIMTELDDDNIVRVVGIVKEPEIMLVMEYLAKGSLIRYLRSLEKDGEDFSRIPFVKFTLDIAKGMEYLESKKIVHRDLAARNILMASENLVKIADFGLSQSLGPGEDIYTAKTPRYLPFRWYAPESIGLNPKFSHKSDVWSFGVTIWEIFTLGEMPKYPTINNNSADELVSLLKTGARLAYPSKNISHTDYMWNTMQKCWAFLPSDRPSFSMLRDELSVFYDKIQ